MRKLFLILLIFLIISFVSAVKINEVELNPSGIDTGNEWIEIYSEEEINLSDYKIVNNDMKEINLSGSFSGYFIYQFEKQWLDNSNESVSLYKNEELIDKTNILADSKNDNKTWQLCNSEWVFEESTKGQENFCSSDEENNQQNQGQENLTNNEMNKTEQTPEINQNIQQTPEIETGNKNTITFETITLTGKDIKSEGGRKYLNKSNYAIYGFIGFCILLGVLFLTKKIKKSDKSEFDEK